MGGISSGRGGGEKYSQKQDPRVKKGRRRKDKPGLSKRRGRGGEGRVGRRGEESVLMNSEEWVGGGERNDLDQVGNVEGHLVDLGVVESLNLREATKNTHISINSLFPNPRAHGKELTSRRAGTSSVVTKLIATPLRPNLPPRPIL